MDIKKEISKLRRWEDAYYNGAPLVPDPTYDAERDRVLAFLKQNHPKHPYLDEVGAPVPDGSIWPKFKHPEVMGSLFKVNNEPDFFKWGSKRGDTYFLSEKADGCTIVAYYEQGKLVTLATRGDGTTGEDITPNARYFHNVALTLPISFTGTLRGEGLLFLDRFKEHFAPLGMANPRNAASGKVRDTKNPHLKRHITVRWFDLIGVDTLDTWEDKFAFIEDTLGLETIPYYPSLTLKQVWEEYDRYVANKRGALNYWIDGLVARVSNLQQHDAFGVTDKRPKGSIAIKFPTTGVITTLVGYELNRGRSGRIAPVGHIKPVQIDGTTVSRVSLHGADWIAQMGIAIGDTVEVAKAGDIIPQIVRKVKEGKNRTLITFPTNCPVCQVKLVRNGAYIECQNKNCAGEKYGALAKWLEKTGIKGIGDSILQDLLAEIEDVADMYEADINVFIRAARGSTKTGKKIYQTVQNTRTLPLAVFLSALHIETLGSTNGQRIADHFKTLANVLGASTADLQAIDGIDKNASKIIQGLHRKAKLIERLDDLLDIQDVVEGAFTGLSFCITGKMQSGKKRSELETWIKDRGGIIQGVSKDLDYLVTDTPDSGSSKNKKADKYGVKKVTEVQLYALEGSAKPKAAPTKAAKPVPRKVVKKSQASTKLPVKKGFGGISLFEDVFGGDAGFIEVVEQKPGKYVIIKSDLVEEGDPAKVKTRLGFSSWESEVEDLDDGISEQSQKLHVSSHLRWDDVELRENSIRAASLDKLKEALSKVTLSSWSEGDL